MSGYNRFSGWARAFAMALLIFAAGAQAQLTAIANFPGANSVAVGEAILVDVGISNTTATPVAGVNFLIDFTNVAFASVSTPAACMPSITTVSPTQLQVTGATVGGFASCVVQLTVQGGPSAGQGATMISAGGPITTGASAFLMVNAVPATQVMSAAMVGPNTLKSVIAYVNTHCTGSDVITFNIPGGGPHTIAPSGGFFFPPLTCNNAVIDGYTQPGAAPNSDGGPSNNADIRIILNGTTCTPGCNGITLSAPGSVVRGLAIRSFPAYGVYVDSGAFSARIEGSYIGTDPGGMSAFPNGSGGVHAGASNMTVGGAGANQRNLITGNPAGVQIFQSSVTVQGNQIGGNRAGTFTFGNTGEGVHAFSDSAQVTSNYVVANGGYGIRFDNNANQANGNTVSNNGAAGIFLSGSGGHPVQNNIVSQHSQGGIEIDSSSNYVATNTVTNNSLFGIRVFSGTQNNLDKNLSYGNTGRGIVHGTGGGGALNDEAAPPYDQDSGANDLQNHPVITTAYQTGGNTVVIGTLKSTPGNAPVRLDFFGNPSMPAVPEGQTNAGSTMLNLDPTGLLSFNVSLPGLHNYISATASVDVCSDNCIVTSEYSPAIAVGPAPPATGTLTPPSLTFPATEVGQVSGSQMVTLTNTGVVDIAISSINLSGPFQFVSGGTCMPGTPVPSGGGTCVIFVSFAPMAVGGAMGMLAVATDAGTFTAGLSGTGTAAPAPVILTVPDSIDFGTQAPGTVSVGRILTLQNGGTASLNVVNILATAPFEITLGPPAAPPMTEGAPTPKAIASPCPTGAFTLIPGLACTIVVTFAPTAAGSFNGIVLINSNIAPFNVLLKGDAGTGKAIAVAPAALNFGDVTFGRTSDAKTFTVSNTGFSQVSISAVQVVPAPAASQAAPGEVADFMLTHDCATLAPSGAPASTAGSTSTCTGTVKFKPGALGPRSADVQITGDFEGGALRVPLDGRGAASPVPLLAFSATRFGFGQSLLGVAQTQSFTISNGGQLPIALNNIFSMGEFFVRHNCPAMLPVGGSCSITTGFAPLLPGPRQGLLVIESNADGSPHRLPLEGTACRSFTPRGARLGLSTCTQ